MTARFFLVECNYIFIHLFISKQNIYNVALVSLAQTHNNFKNNSLFSKGCKFANIALNKESMQVQYKFSRNIDSINFSNSKKRQMCIQYKKRSNKN